MKIGNAEIIIPSEDGLAYDVAWRHTTAMALVCQQGEQRRIPRELRSDQTLKEYCRSLRLKNPSPGSKYQCIRRWYESSLGRLLEAALSTPVTFAKIATDLGLDEDLVEAYGAVFFDVRDGAGKPRPLVILRHTLPEEQLGENIQAMQRAAVSCGYDCMLEMLLPIRLRSDISAQERIQQIAYHEMLRRVLCGQLSNADLCRLINSGVAHARMVHETQPQASEVDEVMSYTLELLQAFAPKMVDPGERTEEENERLTESIREKLAAQETVNQQAVVDAGAAAGKEALDKIFAGKINGDELNFPGE